MSTDRIAADLLRLSRTITAGSDIPKWAEGVLDEIDDAYTEARREADMARGSFLENAHRDITAAFKAAGFDAWVEIVLPTVKEIVMGERTMRLKVTVEGAEGGKPWMMQNQVTQVLVDAGFSLRNAHVWPLRDKGGLRIELVHKL